jgi:hypothetical protein
MDIGGLLKKVYHLATGVSDGKPNPDFVPFSDRSPTSEQVVERHKYLREKYVWRAKTGWGVGGQNLTYPTEFAALAEAERQETQIERLL